MARNRLLPVALLWSLAATLLLACQGPAATSATPAARPAPALAAAPASSPGELALAASKKMVADSAAPPTVAGQTVPFVGRPTVGAAVRAAQANATPR